MEIKIKSALISVSDKSGLEPLIKKLHEYKVNIISTGGTAKFIKKLNIPVTDVSELTQFPEMMDGRVKTLHPNIHGGLLAIRDNKEHKKSQDKFGIIDIDLLISNLYPFEKTINTSNNFETCIENIDIGGPAMLRSASKNHKYVCVISDIGDYTELIQELGDKCSTSLEFRTKYAAKTFERTAHYDGMISHWFKKNSNIKNQKFIEPATIKSELRYGENPHQTAIILQNSFNQSGIPSAQLVQGKELSYNNINDADAALQLIKEFDPKKDAAVAIIKHANPCGVACGESLHEAYHKALACDPNSAFGGIIALNKELDAQTAKSITKIFTEVIIAPDVTDDAKSTPNARDVTIGIRNWACMLVSNRIGTSPTKVVIDVSTIGRKRSSPACCKASVSDRPLRRSSLILSMRTRLSLTTTPEAANTPKKEKSENSMPTIRCPKRAPIMPNGTAESMPSGFR